MYGNIESELLWLRLLAKYLVNECNLNRSKADSCIFFRKDEKGKLELLMSAHMDDVFVAGKAETLKVITEKIKEKFNISESVKVKNFLGVYYEWGHDAKGKYAKNTMEKDVKNIVEG